MSNKRGDKKYRPYFTLTELEFLCDLCKENTNGVTKVEQYLESFIYEISKGYRSASHITTPRMSIEERLGIDVDETQGPTIEEIQAEESKLFGAS